MAGGSDFCLTGSAKLVRLLGRTVHSELHRARRQSHVAGDGKLSPNFTSEARVAFRTAKFRAPPQERHPWIPVL
jgi:hypothetical protein